MSHFLWFTVQQTVLTWSNVCRGRHHKCVYCQNGHWSVWPVLVSDQSLSGWHWHWL